MAAPAEEIQARNIQARNIQARKVSRLRAVLKGVALGSHIFGGFALALVYPLFSTRTQLAILGWWSRTVLAILDVRLAARGMGPEMMSGGALLVANHVSWLDVFALNVVRPACFVAKSEVRSWPVIGTLCKRARTIFISRARRADTVAANRLMAAHLAAGECVALFPEGTSTDGSDVLPFRSPLFQCAVEAGCAVVPVAIQYRDVNGDPCPEAAFIGEMTFLQSLTGILSCRTLDVSLVFLGALDSAAADRRRVAAVAHALVAGEVRRQNDPGFGASSAKAAVNLP